MRAISGLTLSLLLICSTSSGQSLGLQGSAGPTITDQGYRLAAGIGFSPNAPAWSRPHVNATVPDSVTNDVRALCFGGGIHVSLRERISLFADARMIVGAEAAELRVNAGGREEQYHSEVT